MYNHVMAQTEKEKRKTGDYCGLKLAHVFSLAFTQSRSLTFLWTYNTPTMPLSFPVCILKKKKKRGTFRVPLFLQPQGK